MGGFGAVIGSLAEKAGPALADVLERTVSAKTVLNYTKEGSAIAQRFPIYQQVYKQTEEALLPGALKEHAERAKIYEQQAKVGASGPGPRYPAFDTKDIHIKASRTAREALLGPKDALGVVTANAIARNHGTYHAQAFSDTMAFLLKDNTKGQLRGYPTAAATVDKSLFKERVMNSGVPLKNSNPTYQPNAEWENSVKSFLYQTFSPLIAVPHVATVFNGLLGTDPGTFLKGVVGSLGNVDSKIDKFEALVNSGAFAESHMEAVRDWNKLHSAQSPIASNPVTQLVYKMFHQPGFRPLRDYSLLSGANVGMMTAKQVAKDFHLNSSDPKLQWQLREFGLNPAKILSQKGELDETDLGTAVFRFVDRHYFLDNTLQRSRLLQSTPVGRVLGMYHGYVTRQSKLMARSMILNMRKQGVAASMKNLAVGAILFPALGEGVKLVQETIRGQDSVGDAEKDFENISGQNGAQEMFMTYGEALGHVAAFGVYNHIVRGALKQNLVATMAGPAVSAASWAAQDAVRGVAKTWKNPSNIGSNFAPLGRDVLADTPGVSLLAQLLEKQIFPKKGEHPERAAYRRLYHHMRNEDLQGEPLQEEAQEKEN